MNKVNTKYLALSIALCVVAAVLGGMLTGDALETWYPTLRQPALSLPLEAWYVVGGVYYIMAIALLYQIFVTARSALRNNAFILTLVMIAGNEFWNYLFFGLQSPFAAFIGLVPFTLLVLTLFIVLRRLRKSTSWILLPYLIWLGYDLYWTYGLWQFNP